MKFDDSVWYSPISFDQLLRLKRLHPNSRLISGSNVSNWIILVIRCLDSELAVELKFRFIELPVAINPKQIPELRECYLDRKRKSVYIGMGLSLSEVKDRLNGFISELPGL